MRRFYNYLIKFILIPFALIFTICCMGTDSCQCAEYNCKRDLSKCIPYDGKLRDVLCWGDSMTEGIGCGAGYICIDDKIIDITNQTYPSTLQGLTGLNVYNCGVSGATSEEIAIMQGGIRARQKLQKYDNIRTDLMKKFANRRDDILILEIGSNGGWDNDYSKLISQYNAMIEHSGCKYYIIIGDTDNPGESIDENQHEIDENGDYVGLQDTLWEAALREAYGDHFINMRTWLIENGLKVLGLDVTNEATDYVLMGKIPMELRDDNTHLNSYGYFAKGIAVYEKGLELKYW